MLRAPCSDPLSTPDSCATTAAVVSGHGVASCHVSLPTSLDGNTDFPLTCDLWGTYLASRRFTNMPGPCTHGGLCWAPFHPCLLAVLVVLGMRGVGLAQCDAFKRIFVTSTTYDGNLGGLAGADAKCAARGAAAGLSGSAGSRGRSKTAQTQ